jgi:hypothetical protein
MSLLSANSTSFVSFDRSDMGFTSWASYTPFSCVMTPVLLMDKLLIA